MSMLLNLVQITQLIGLVLYLLCAYTARCMQYYDIHGTHVCAFPSIISIMLIGYLYTVHLYMYILLWTYLYTDACTEVYI